MEAEEYKVIGTFEYGKLVPRVCLILLCVLSALLGLAIIGVVCVHKGFVQQDFIIVLCFSLFMFLSFVALTIYFVTFNKYHKKKIEEWRQDAILTEGIIERLPGLLSDRAFIITIIYKKGKKIVKFPSEDRSKFPIRCARYFDTLIGAKIPVLYSPKYNQVIFIQLPERYDPID